MRFTRHSSVWMIVVCVLVVAAGGWLYAELPGARLVGSADAEPYAGTVPDVLPPVERGPMKVSRDVVRATQLLQFDDGTCEAGLGLTTGSWSSLVDFDVPTQCVQSGLSIVGLSVKANTNTLASFVMHQSGAAPGSGVASTALTTPIVGNGACPAAQTMQTQAIAPGSMVVTGTQNFFAGVYGNCYMGRDSDSVSAGRMWLCTGAGASCYSPTYLAGIGYGGNWMIRVTVEDTNCVPVELQSFGVE